MACIRAVRTAHDMHAVGCCGCSTKVRPGNAATGPEAPFATHSVYRRACSSRHVTSAGDDIGTAKEGADFCAVQVTGDCLIAFYGHDGVDVHRTVSDLSGTGHLGR